MPATESRRFYDLDVGFAGGMRSDVDPVQLRPGYVWNAINMVFRGGVARTRPGFRCIASFPKEKIQAIALYRPREGSEQCVVVIGGHVYVSTWPFSEWKYFDEPTLSGSADIVYTCLAEQSVTREDLTQQNSRIVFIDPQNVLILQDGVSPPLVYDGTKLSKATDDNWGVPIGTHMAWVGDRLWIARDNYLFASDISNPLSFRESDILGASYGFVLPGEITALAKLESLERAELLVFTGSSCTLIRASVRDREQWINIADFQQEIFKIGCVSARSVIPAYGQLYWLSPSGLVSLDAAKYSRISSYLPVQDLEMAISKAWLHENLTMAAGANFGPYVLLSVPHADLYNSHTWVLDLAGADPTSSRPIPVWNGVWTGIRPVQWLYGYFAGRERIFALSMDYDNTPRLWEAFTSERTDSGCPITWALETRAYFSPTSGSGYPPFRLKRLAWFELQLVELSGDVWLAGWWAGASRGPYYRCLTKKITANRASITSDRSITESTSLYNTKPQARLVRSEDARFSGGSEAVRCNVESNNVSLIDSEFQLLLIGSGDCGIRSLRVFAEPYSESTAGACEVSEENYNLVKYSGESASAERLSEAAAQLETRGFDYWESYQTVALSQDGVTAVASGDATSLISQQHADELAKCIATKRAEYALQRMLPPIVSIGYTPTEWEGGWSEWNWTEMSESS